MPSWRGQKQLCLTLYPVVALDPLHCVRTVTAFFSLLPNTVSLWYCSALKFSSVLTVPYTGKQQLAQLTVQVAGDKGVGENGVRMSRLLKGGVRVLHLSWGVAQVGLQP